MGYMGNMIDKLSLCRWFPHITILMAGNESCVKTTKHIWFVIGRSEASIEWTLGGVRKSEGRGIQEEGGKEGVTS